MNDIDFTDSDLQGQCGVSTIVKIEVKLQLRSSYKQKIIIKDRLCLFAETLILIEHNQMLWSSNKYYLLHTALK